MWGGIGGGHSASKAGGLAICIAVSPTGQLFASARPRKPSFDVRCEHILAWRLGFSSLSRERETKKNSFVGCHDRRKSTNSCKLVITYVQFVLYLTKKNSFVGMS